MLKKWEQEKAKILTKISDQAQNNRKTLALENMEFDGLDENILSNSMPTCQVSVGGVGVK